MTIERDILDILDKHRACWIAPHPEVIPLHLIRKICRDHNLKLYRILDETDGEDVYLVTKIRLRKLVN